MTSKPTLSEQPLIVILWSLTHYTHIVACCYSFGDERLSWQVAVAAVATQGLSAYRRRPGAGGQTLHLAASTGAHPPCGPCCNGLSLSNQSLASVVSQTVSEPLQYLHIIGPPLYVHIPWWQQAAVAFSDLILFYLCLPANSLLHYSPTIALHFHHLPSHSHTITHTPPHVTFSPEMSFHWCGSCQGLLLSKGSKRPAKQEEQ